MDTNEIIYKTEVESHVENKVMVTRERAGGGTNWKIGIDIYTLLYTKYITDKDLLYRTISSILCNGLHGKRI